MSEKAKVTVQDNPDHSRFEAVDESGVVAGFVQYVERDGNIVFVHTEVDDAFEGQGVGSALASGALDQARDSGQPVIAECPFIKSYIDKHPEYQHMLAG
jgi:predicted GNAT family acetyltransferase